MVASQRMNVRSIGRLALLALLVPCLVPLLGAADLGAYPAPVVVVYPLTTTGPSKADTGGNVALLLATKLAQLGAVTVKPSTPGTPRSGYLDAARALSADYYVAGFLTPVGDELAMIAQVVSTTSGSVIYSTTTMVRTYGDAAAQADDLHTAIVRHAGRGLPALNAPPAESGSTPNPSVSGGGGVNLTQVLGRKRRSAPAAGASATPSPAASSAAGTSPATAPSPSRVANVGQTPPGALVAQVGGPADTAARTYAGTAFSAALRRQGMPGGVLPVTGEQAVAHAADLCRANVGSRFLYAGTLAVAGSGQAAQVLFDVAAFDCRGTLLGRQHASATASGRGGLNAAIDRAAGEAAQTLHKGIGAG